MNIATTIKGVSWMDIFTGMQVGDYKDCPLEKETTIRPLISSRVKDRYPDRIYQVNKTQDQSALRVLRVK